MRILLIHPHDIYSSLEPWTTRITAIGSELIRRGHEVKLIYHIHPDRELESGNESTSEGNAVSGVGPVQGPQLYSFETVPVKRTQSLRSSVARISPYIWWADAVHLQKALTYAALPVMYSCIRLNKALHYDWDDWESGILEESGGSGAPLKLMRTAEFILPIIADTVSVASKPLYNKALKLGVHPVRLAMAPVGVDLDLFRPDAPGSEKLAERLGIDREYKYLSYHGQLEGAFGLDLLIEAATVLLPRYSNWRLMVAGEGRMRSSMEKLAEKRGIDHLVTFTGALEHHEIPAYLGLVDISVATFADTAQSKTKSPLKVVETLAAGVPLVATKTGEVPEMTGNAAILAEPADIKSLINSIEKLMDNSEIRKEYSVRARSRAEKNLSWSSTVSNLLNLYEIAVARRRTPSLRKFIKDNLDLMGIVSHKVFTGPRMIQLDPTSRCNNDCIACWTRSPLLGKPPEDDGPELSTSRALQLLREAWEMGTKEIYIAGGGEPFCHPGIWEIIKYAKELRMIVTVNTNFTLLKPSEMQRLIDLRVDWLTVSVWAGSASVYSRVHPNKNPETFYRIRDNLRILTRDRVDVPKIKIYNVMFNLNYRDIHNMMDFARDIQADGVEFTVADVIPGSTDSLLLNDEERRWLYQETLSMSAEEKRRGGGPVIIGLDRFLARLGDQNASKGDYDASVIDSVPCTTGWTFLRVMPDGNVNPCLKAHRWPVGNINHLSLSKIWNSQKQRHFRRACSDRKRFSNFFNIIGNDPDAKCGCYRGCDDIARNQDIQRRMNEMGKGGRKVLEISGSVLGLGGKLRRIWKKRHQA